MRLGVIADDLTGALDTGVQFTRAGLSTYMALERSALDRKLRLGASPLDVAVVNTRARSLPRRSLVIQETLLSLPALESAERLFVKIDSTLRGNWRSVIEAVSAARGLRAVVCPAFPAQGRTVRQDAVYLADDRRVGSVRLPQDPVSRDWIVPDARTDADLDAIVETYWNDPEILFCGSAGLAGAVARRLSQGTPVRVSDGWKPARRVAVVIGSRTELTRAQIARLCEEERAGEEIALFLAPDGDGEEDPGVARGLAKRLTEEHERRAFDGLVLSGGETADQVLTHLQAETVELAAEPLPGCPLGVLRGWTADGARVITKSGSFGERDTLVRLVRMLQGGST